MRKTVVGAILLLAMIAIASASAQDVCRDLPDGSLAPGSTATVTLTVTVDGADFYAIDEVLPAGWEIVDAGGGNTADPGHIKWIALQNAEDTTYTYQVRVPEGAAEGTYTFSGDFQMQGMDNPAPISCDSSVEVAEGPQPTIAQPSKGDMLSGMATIVEVDESGRNITYNLFEYYPDLNCDGKANDGAGWVEIYNDTNGDDGWSAEWDTVTVPDGCYIIRATMGDDEGLTGSDQTSVIACNPPEPSIPNPGDGASVAGTITIEAVDDSGQNDVVKSVFEYAPAADTTWTLIGEDTDGSDGWSVDWNASGVEDGEYLIRATMYDTCSSAEETITITVVSGSIVLHPGWNLISVVCGLDNSSVDHVLEGIDYEAVISYNACNGGWESVTDIEPLKAYWIKVESMQVITNLECGASVPPSMQLCEGWNIIGHLLKSPASAETTLFMIDESYDRIWVWNAEEQTHDLYGYNCNVWPYPCPPLVSGEHVTTEDFVMQPHAGYWIHVTSETTLEALES